MMLSLLVADDTPIIRSTVVRVVERDMSQFEAVIAASNGLEAVEFARTSRPDIVLMDIKMPGMDGLQASAIIRADLPSTKIVILSAYDDFAYAQRALKLGVVDYLLKPLRPASLAEILGKLADQIQSERAVLPSAAPGGDGAAVVPALPEDPIIRQVLEYILQNHHRPDISLAEVAEAINLSPSHLAHVLKEKAGVSYKQYLTTQRIAAAKKLLITTNMTIEAIAESVGYQNVTNFYRLFQRETGLTPAAYRRSVEPAGIG